MPDGLGTVISQIGSIVETPALFPTMTGRRNLSLLGRLDGHGPRAVDAALDRVGLAERADDLVKTYSLGMKQRLGLAAALLKDPALLILDEPANGLDPAGIREIRFLLRALADEGRTVLVSSHQLAEVQLTCDSVAIVDRGRTVAAGPVDEVLRLGGTTGLLVRVDDLAHGSGRAGGRRLRGHHGRCPPSRGRARHGGRRRHPHPRLDGAVGVRAARRGGEPRGPLPRDHRRLRCPTNEEVLA